MRAIRDEQGLSRLQVARASGLQQTWISHIENGRRDRLEHVAPPLADLGLADVSKPLHETEAARECR